MIATIQGTLLRKSATYVVIDVQGVGYGVHVPLSTFYNLPETGESVFLNIFTYVKEDLINLFGFLTTQEKEIFQLMISVSGIGPRLAINILSGISAQELGQAISMQNFTQLTSIPGVGKKMAERIIFELKDKVIQVLADTEPVFSRPEPVKDDALSALTNLGYKKNVAKKAIDAICAEYEEPPTLEVLITETLKQLST